MEEVNVGQNSVQTHLFISPVLLKLEIQHYGCMPLQALTFDLLLWAKVDGCAKFKDDFKVMTIKPSTTKDRACTKS